MAAGDNYAFKVIIAIDRFAAAVVLRDADITISSECGLALRANPNGTTLMHRLGRLLNRINPGHCEAAIASDIARAIAMVVRLDPAWAARLLALTEPPA